MSQSNFIAAFLSISNKIDRSKILRHLFFALATTITILFLGYYLGTFDQASHIPFLKKYADPSLFPNDPFVDLRNLHYSYFWFLFLPFYRLKILEVTMFLTYFCTTYLTYYAIWRLSKTLFNNAVAAVLSVITFIIPHVGFAGFTLFEFSLLNRTFVLPFLLISINWYLQKKTVATFVLLGILYNLHVISVNFVLCMFGLDILLNLKKTSLKNLIVSAISFLVCASPVLIWKFSSSPLDIHSNNHEWFTIVSEGMLYHLFNLFSTNPNILILTAGGIASIFLFFIAKKRSASKHNKTITNFVYAAIIVLLIQIVSTAFFPATIIIQSQIVRIGLFIVLFAYLYFAEYLSQLVSSEQKSGIITLTLSYFFSLSPLILFTVYLLKKAVPIKKTASVVVSLLLCGTFVVLLYAASQIGVWRPGIYPFGTTYSTYYDVQLWAKQHTSKNAIFITPPYKWWFYETEWRVFSERRTVVTLSELLEAAFAPEYIPGWKSRFEDIAPGALSQFHGDVFTNFKVTKNAYSRLNEKDFLRLSKKYNAHYIVVEKPTHYHFPKVYENRDYVVYFFGD